jgi:hypothetical protein
VSTGKAARATAAAIREPDLFHDPAGIRDEAELGAVGPAGMLEEPKDGHDVTRRLSRFCERLPGYHPGATKEHRHADSRHLAFGQPFRQTVIERIARVCEPFEDG